jgi:hypothetical protein
MDFLSFDPTFAILICTRCQYALIPSGIRTSPDRDILQKNSLSATIAVHKWRVLFNEVGHRFCKRTLYKSHVLCELAVTVAHV